MNRIRGRRKIAKMLIAALLLLGFLGGYEGNSTVLPADYAQSGWAAGKPDAVDAAYRLPALPVEAVIRGGQQRNAAEAYEARQRQRGMQERLAAPAIGVLSSGISAVFVCSGFHYYESGGFSKSQIITFIHDKDGKK